MKYTKRILAALLVALLTLGMFAVGAAAAPDIGPDESGAFGAGSSTVFGTTWPSTILNWFLFIVCFGWIWMWIFRR